MTDRSIVYICGFVTSDHEDHTISTQNEIISFNEHCFGLSLIFFLKTNIFLFWN